MVSFINKRKNGELFWELASIAPVKDGDKITNFVAVKEDITERKQMEEQLRQSQKMQAVGQLTGGIAHDFNNLLAIVMGNLQLLGERVSGDAKAREYLDDALWSAKRGGELTHRLLAFARKQPLKPAVIDLNDVVRGMTDLLRRTLGASIRIEESLAPNLWKAFADRGELERALVNLAVNARDAMRERRHAHAGDVQRCPRRGLCRAVRGGDARRVRAARRHRYRNRHVARDYAAGVRAVLHDEGGGTGKRPGLEHGLRLRQAVGRARQHLQPGRARHVREALPAAGAVLPGGAEEEFSGCASGGPGEQGRSGGRGRGKATQGGGEDARPAGAAESMQAETAKDALELLADTHVDVLFTDIELPGGMNGTELADAAQKLDPNIKVLFTTGYARETTLHERGLHERAPWLLKPYSHQNSLAS